MSSIYVQVLKSFPAFLGPGRLLPSPAAFAKDRKFFESSFIRCGTCSSQKSHMQPAWLRRTEPRGEAMREAARCERECEPPSIDWSSFSCTVRASSRTPSTPTAYAYILRRRPVWRVKELLTTSSMTRRCLSCKCIPLMASTDLPAQHGPSQPVPAYQASPCICRLGEGGGETFYTDWNESYEVFDQMNLHESLLRGIYAYGAQPLSRAQLFSS